MAEKVIIFDFDGTIADTLPTIVRVINRLSGKFGYKNISEESIEMLRNKKIGEILKDLKISRIKIPFILRNAKSEINKEIESLKPTVAIKESLSTLNKNKYRLGILTSNSKDNVTKFLKSNNLEFFDFIYSGISIFGKSRVIKRLLKQQNLRPDEVIYVGDEIRDIEAAKKAGIKIIAVSWGFNSKKVLEEQTPDYLVNEPKELIKLLGNRGESASRDAE